MSNRQLSDLRERLEEIRPASQGGYVTTETTIEARVKKIVAEQLDLTREVSPTALLIDDLGADDLAMAEIIAALEQEYNLEIPAGDAENIRTVNDAITYVRMRAQR
jgi:acyl carrier protein